MPISSPLVCVVNYIYISYTYVYVYILYILRNLHFLQQYPGYITTLSLKSQCLHFTHQYQEAESMYYKTMYTKEYCYGTHHLDYTATLNSFGLMQLDRGIYIFLYLYTLWICLCIYLLTFIHTYIHAYILHTYIHRLC